MSHVTKSRWVILGQRDLSRLATARHRQEVPEVRVYWGTTGTGKSKQAFEDAKENNQYWKDSTGWWDGYSPGDVVIIDDFKGSWWDITFMLKLLDRYPLRVQV